MSVNKGTALTKDEVALLISLIKSNKAITSKATNASNNLTKEAAWTKLTNSFNASISSCPRRVEQLKLKWENLKKSARKRTQKIRMNSVQTGGGKPPYIPPDDSLDKVSEILGATCEGYTVPFGGDSEECALFVTTEDQDTCEIASENIEQAGDDTGAGTSTQCSIVKVSDPKNINYVIPETPTIKKFFFNSAKSNYAKQKRKLLEEDIKARTERNKAIASYYAKKEKREEMEYENKKLENEKLKLELERASLENEKLKM